MYLTNTYSDEILAFTVFAICTINSVPIFLPKFSLTSSMLFIENIHTVLFPYLSIVLFPRPYKYSAEFNPVNLSTLYIFSIVF